MRWGHPILVWDLKRIEDKLTPTEEKLAAWFVSHGIPYTILRVSENKKVFNLEPFAGGLKVLTEQDLIQYINNLGEIMKVTH